MPTYDYVCATCGHEIEIMHSVHGQGPACPQCGSAMKKAISAPAVHFRGTGWARKERGSTKPAKAEPKEPGSSVTSDAGSGTGASSESSGTSSGGTSGASSSGSSGASTPQDGD